MKIALVGNQNSGKTTLFNALTGMNAKIGNWPGVTIEKKEGFIKGTRDIITDLPGIYSLSPYSIEEDVSRKYIFNENPDIIINIIDSTNLERSLYLTTQLLELDSKVIIALNMADILEKKGMTIDIDNLENMLGVKVIKISALKNLGIESLKKELNINTKDARKKIYDEKIEKAITKIEYEIPQNMIHKKFLAVKLLEDDIKLQNLNNEQIEIIKKELSQNYDTDLEETIAIERYEYIEYVKKYTVTSIPVKETISDRLDRILLNKWLAFPIFVLIMFFIYYLSVGVIGNSTVDIISNLVEKISEIVKISLINIGTSDWLNSLITDGIITGVGSVLSFLPQLIILFICISILETTGYMARIALLLDRLFRKIGLSGKSLIPFIIGSGCSVPAIMGTRIIENQDEREMTTILTPFIPCSAKLPIIALFSGFFFKENSGIVSASLYFLAITIIICSAIMLKKFVFKNTSNTYIAELPEYKLPSIKYILKDVRDKIGAFIKRAGSVILICSTIIWFLLSFSFKLKYGVNIDESILATIGKSISWIFYPMLGTNSWETAVSAIQGLVAKEQVISSMSVIAGFNNIEDAKNILGEKNVFGFFTASSAYAFMIFNLFSAPCFGAIGAMSKELGERKKMLKAIGFQTSIAWILATIVYQVGTKIENKTINLSNILIISGITLLVIRIAISIKESNKCNNCTYIKTCNKS